MSLLDAISSDKRYHIEQGDCVEILRSLPDACVDAIITDWPYGVKIADWDMVAPYPLINEFLRVSRGVVLTFGAAVQIHADMLGFPVPPERTLIWAPGFSTSHTQAKKVFFRFHPIYVWRIPEKHNGFAHDVLRHNTNAGAGKGKMGWKHECTKPSDLMYAICGFAPDGGTVLDPFVGSGSTAVGALRRGQRAFGIEMQAEHVQTSRDRCEAELIGLSLKDARNGQRSIFEEVA
jgi:site-specific DNA-methyltransferase (adenine-specific)